MLETLRARARGCPQREPKISTTTPIFHDQDKGRETPTKNGSLRLSLRVPLTLFLWGCSIATATILTQARGIPRQREETKRADPFSKPAFPLKQINLLRRYFLSFRLVNPWQSTDGVMKLSLRCRYLIRRRWRNISPNTDTSFFKTSALRFGNPIGANHFML